MKVLSEKECVGDCWRHDKNHPDEPCTCPPTPLNIPLERTVTANVKIPNGDTVSLTGAWKAVLGFADAIFTSCGGRFTSITVFDI